VFTQVEFQNTVDGTIAGDMFTYQALLKEAQKVGADAIINVTIDRHIEIIKTVEIVSSQVKQTETKQETWYGSALAIRYTGAIAQAQLTQGPLTTSGTRERNVNGGSSAVPESGENAQQAPSGNAPVALKGFFKQR